MHRYRTFRAIRLQFSELSCAIIALLSRSNKSPVEVDVARGKADDFATAQTRVPGD
jgi:hypothetical protein